MANKLFKPEDFDKGKEVTPPSPAKSWWIWIVGGLLLAIGIACFVYVSKNDRSDVPAIDDVEIVATQTNDSSVVDTAPALSSDMVDETQVVQSEQTDPQSVSSQREEPIRPTQSNDVETLAYDVIRGNYGNGEARKEALGSKYSEVQLRVNQIYQEKGW